MNASWRPTVAEIDLGALRSNVAAFVAKVSPAMVCAVVKADAYGHGAVECARAAVAAGAGWLGVALVEEAVELREAAIDAPILVLSEFPDAAADAILRYGITPTVYSLSKIELLAGIAKPGPKKIGVHIKVDTGMHRVGARPHEVMGLAQRIRRLPAIELAGVFTHLAVADAPDDRYTNDQLDRFEAVLSELRRGGIDTGIVHASNSAGALAHHAARFDMVRIGVALYGNDPDSALPAVDHGVDLRPILTLRSAVSHVKVLAAGARVSYGLRYTFDRESVVATVPIGYADGLARRYSSVGGEVLLGGRRRPIVGRITMDQLLVDCGPPDPVNPIMPGDEVVLLGSQGAERITPWDMAIRLDTIAYEVTCGIGKRVPRVYVDNDGTDENPSVGV
jgi:alanine racemase